jgi:hypothetical protein
MLWSKNCLIFTILCRLLMTITWSYQGVHFASKKARPTERSKIWVKPWQNKKDLTFFGMLVLCIRQLIQILKKTFKKWASKQIFGQGFRTPGPSYNEESLWSFQNVWTLMIFHLFVTSIHQFILTNPWIFFYYEYFNDAVKCILMPYKVLERIRWFQSRKNNESIIFW